MYELFPVEIRLKSEDYSNLREKLTSPIQVARQVVIRQSLSDQFLAAFSAQVARNGVYHLPPGSPVSILIFSLFVLLSLMPLSPYLAIGTLLGMFTSYARSEVTENVCTNCCKNYNNIFFKMSHHNN